MSAAIPWPMLTTGAPAALTLHSDALQRSMQHALYARDAYYAAAATATTRTHTHAADADTSSDASAAWTSTSIAAAAGGGVTAHSYNVSSTTLTAATRDDDKDDADSDGGSGRRHCHRGNYSKSNNVCSHDGGSRLDRSDSVDDAADMLLLERVCGGSCCSNSSYDGGHGSVSGRSNNNNNNNDSYNDSCSVSPCREQPLSHSHRTRPPRQGRSRGGGSSDDRSCTPRRRRGTPHVTFVDAVPAQQRGNNNNSYVMASSVDCSGCSSVSESTCNDGSRSGRRQGACARGDASNEGDESVSPWSPPPVSVYAAPLRRHGSLATTTAAATTATTAVLSHDHPLQYSPHDTRHDYATATTTTTTNTASVSAASPSLTAHSSLPMHDEVQRLLCKADAERAAAAHKAQQLLLVVDEWRQRALQSQHELQTLQLTSATQRDALHALQHEYDWLAGLYAHDQRSYAVSAQHALVAHETLARRDVAATQSRWFVVLQRDWCRGLLRLLQLRMQKQQQQQQQQHDDDSGGGSKQRRSRQRGTHGTDTSMRLLDDDDDEDGDDDEEGDDEQCGNSNNKSRRATAGNAAVTHSKATLVQELVMAKNALEDEVHTLRRQLAEEQQRQQQRPHEQQQQQTSATTMSSDRRVACAQCATLHGQLDEERALTLEMQVEIDDLVCCELRLREEAARCRVEAAERDALAALLWRWQHEAQQQQQPQQHLPSSSTHAIAVLHARSTRARDAAAACLDAVSAVQSAAQHVAQLNNARSLPQQQQQQQRHEQKQPQCLQLCSDGDDDVDDGSVYTPSAHARTLSLCDVNALTRTQHKRTAAATTTT